MAQAQEPPADALQVLEQPAAEAGKGTTLQIKVQAPGTVSEEIDLVPTLVYENGDVVDPEHFVLRAVDPPAPQLTPASPSVTIAFRISRISRSATERAVCVLVTPTFPPDARTAVFGPATSDPITIAPRARRARPTAEDDDEATAQAIAFGINMGPHTAAATAQAMLFGATEQYRKILESVFYLVRRTDRRVASIEESLRALAAASTGGPESVGGGGFVAPPHGEAGDSAARPPHSCGGGGGAVRGRVMTNSVSALVRQYSALEDEDEDDAARRPLRHAPGPVASMGAPPPPPSQLQQRDATVTGGGGSGAAGVLLPPPQAPPLPLPQQLSGPIAAVAPRLPPAQPSWPPPGGRRLNSLGSIIGGGTSIDSSLFPGGGGPGGGGSSGPGNGQHPPHTHPQQHPLHGGSGSFGFTFYGSGGSGGGSAVYGGGGPDDWHGGQGGGAGGRDGGVARSPLPPAHNTLGSIFGGGSASSSLGGMQQLLGGGSDLSAGGGGLVPGGGAVPSVGGLAAAVTAIPMLRATTIGDGADGGGAVVDAYPFTQQHHAALRTGGEAPPAPYVHGHHFGTQVAQGAAGQPAMGRGVAAAPVPTATAGVLMPAVMSATPLVVPGSGGVIGAAGNGEGAAVAGTKRARPDGDVGAGPVPGRGGAHAATATAAAVAAAAATAASSAARENALPILMDPPRPRD